MNDLNRFYQSILNIGNTDYEKKIKKIVAEEKDMVSSNKNVKLTGLCKYLANQIECRIKEDIPGVHITKIDLREFDLVDHTILVVEYRNNSGMKRLLIDPTFIQFVRKDTETLIKLEKWPSDKLDKTTLTNLLNAGVSVVDNETFQNYLESFTEGSIEVSLDEYLLKEKINHHIR